MLFLTSQVYVFGEGLINGWLEGGGGVGYGGYEGVRFGYEYSDKLTFPLISSSAGLYFMSPYIGAIRIGVLGKAGIIRRFVSPEIIYKNDIIITYPLIIIYGRSNFANIGFYGGYYEGREREHSVGWLVGALVDIKNILATFEYGKTDSDYSYSFLVIDLLQQFFQVDIKYKIPLKGTIIPYVAIASKIYEYEFKRYLRGHKRDFSLTASVGTIITLPISRYLSSFLSNLSKPKIIRKKKPEVIKDENED